MPPVIPAPAPAPAPRRRPSWAGRDFRVQTAAAFVSGLGSAAAPVAAAFAVLGADGSAGDVGWVTAARLLPAVVFVLLGGALADRLPRHRVMVAANVGSAAVQAAFAVLVLTGHPQLWQMLALSAAAGTAQAFYMPAAQGVVLAAVDPADAGRAFAFYRLALNAAQIGGTALGGVLVAAVGPGWVLAADAAGFALAAGLRTLLRVPPPARAREASANLARELLEGWQEFASRRWLWAVVLQFAVVMACVLATESVYGPVVAAQRLGGAGPWGLALAAQGVGMVAGGLLMLRWRPRRILLAGNWGVLAFALPAAALAASAPVPVLAGAMLLSGVGTEVFGVNWMVALQQEIPAERMARVSAYDWLGSLALSPVGTAVAGPVAVWTGLTGALWAAAGVTAALALLAVAVPEVRQLRRAQPGVVRAGHPGGVPEPAAVTPG
ncbi:MFS transporter [Streptomyces sp. NPDC001380]|uniref:MFS transporter n=1 Tax=Streptomyces sp. NPDC001380 TaxID=3364566 RepID=UPI00368EAF42